MTQSWGAPQQCPAVDQRGGRCQLVWGHAGGHSAVPAPAFAPAAKKAGNPVAGCLALVVMGGIAWWIFGPSGGAAVPARVKAPAAAWQPPAGYMLAPGEPSVAVRWMDAPEVKCTYSTGSCWGIEAIARDGCPTSLYIEVSLLDSGGAAIGYTNDVAGSVTPGQHAKMTFDTFKDGIAHARISDVACY